MSEWFKNPWSKFISVMISISTIFGIGFGIGKYSESLNNRLEIIELNQKFYEKLNLEIDNCRKENLLEYRKTAEEVEKMVNELRKNVK